VPILASPAVEGAPALPVVVVVRRASVMGTTSVMLEPPILRWVRVANNCVARLDNANE